MKKIYSLIMTLALVAGLSSCSDNWTPGNGGSDEGEGQVNLVSMGVEVSTAEAVVSRDGGVVTDLSDYIVTIENAQSEKAAEWKYSEMPEVFTLPVGTYTVTVKSHNVAKAEWEAPLYQGSKSFEIREGEITDVGVILCKLANIKVSISFTDQLRARLGDDVTVTVVANDEGSLVYTTETTQAGYFEALPGSSTLVATFHGTINGESAPVTLRKVYDDVKAGTHYRITFSLKSGDSDIPEEIGGISLSDGLTLDGTITTVNQSGSADVDEDIITGERPQEGEDEPGTDPDPGTDPNPGTDPSEVKITITSETLQFAPATNDPSVTPAVVNIHADNGIKNLVVNISTDNANFEASVSELMPLTFDLAYPGEYAEAFAGLGFKVGSEVIDATDVPFDITSLAPLLSAFPGTHNFTLTVTDNANKQLQKVIIYKAN